MEERRGYILQARLDKLAALRRLGIEPFAYAYDVSDRTDGARAAFEAAESSGGLDESGLGPDVSVAGRLSSLRPHGKATFGDLVDRTGRLQVYFRADRLSAQEWELLSLLDAGDWIGVRGPTLRTRTGEVTVRAATLTLLAKTLRPLPWGKAEQDPETGERVVHGGFSDVEQRYRQRYADLAVNADVREVFVQRARVVSCLRRYLDERGYIEVETPVLQSIYGGASARPFVTHHNALDIPLFLRIADELYLKRLIVGGLERVYEISKDFRNEGIDRFHNPEFTMLEFYEAFADYEDMMARVEEMLVTVVREMTGGDVISADGRSLSIRPPFARLPFLDALQQRGVDARVATDDELRAAARAAGIDSPAGLTRPKLLDELFKHLVEPDLEGPIFVTDHPRELSPLAKPKRGDPDLVERFELYVLGTEIANAFSELNDPIDQRERFEAQGTLRLQGDDEAQVLDEDYIRALEYGLPPTGGVGVGIDRLVMLLTGQSSLRDVILFPTMRPEVG